MSKNIMQEDQKSIRLITKIIIALSIVIAAVSVYILLVIDLPTKPIAGQGSQIEDNAQIGGDFTLTDYNGAEFNSEIMKGRLSLVYFGFTYCPDICPTSLQKLSAVLAALDKYNIDVLPIFITVDPERDNAALLKEYLSHFHPKFIGLTGTPAQIKEVAALYKVFYARAPNADINNNNYMLDHSSFVYLMDKKGKYMKHFALNSSADEIIEYIRINK